MKCPIDGAALVMTDRSGVEIDYCPECRGVWLDRGELDKIIERSASVPPPAPQQAYRDEGHRDQEYRGKRKKKDGLGSMLGDIFDF